jgi:hypothetical protein
MMMMMMMMTMMMIMVMVMVMVVVVGGVTCDPMRDRLSPKVSALADLVSALG